MKKISYLIAFLLISLPIQAQQVAPLETVAKQAFLVDANSGTVLFTKDADSHMPTSSMSKMMVIYLTFEAIKNGKLKMDDTLVTSEHAWRQEGSRMFLNVGQAARVEDLIRGVVIQSGNDAAVVLAEALGGSEQNFATMMNEKARQLGMTNSNFTNAPGLPDPEHYSTARDLATLAIALIRDFPEHYHYFSEIDFTYNNIKQGNRNPLLYHNMNVDGLKTGHTEIGGFGLTVSALRDGRRLVLVLNGLPSMQSRADESAKVLDWGYREFGLYTVAKEGDKMAEADVWLGKAPKVSLTAPQNIFFTLPRSGRADLKANVVFSQPIQAPVTKGQALGKLIVTALGMDEKEFPLVAAEDVPQLGLFARMAAKLHFMFSKS